MPPHAGTEPLLYSLFEALRRGFQGGDAMRTALKATAERFCPACGEDLEDALRDVMAGAECLHRANQDKTQEVDPWAADRAAALSLLERLPACRRLGRARLLRGKLRGVGAAVALLDRARAALPADPAASEVWAQCALLVSQREGRRDPTQARLYDRQAARAWAFWGNARRALGDLREAERMLERAGRNLAGIPGPDVFALAEQRSFLASLRRDQRRFDEAEILAETVVELYEAIGDDAAALRNRIVLLTIYSAAQSYEPLAASAAEVKALALTVQENRALWSGVWFEAWALAQLGEVERARRIVETERKALDQFADDAHRVRVLWLEAKIHERAKNREAAETLYKGICEHFVAVGAAFDAGQVALDLAGLYLAYRQYTKAAALALTVQAVFEAGGVSAEAQAAWRLFTDAVQRRTANVQWAREMARYLQHARRDPQYSFPLATVL